MTTATSTALASAPPPSQDLGFVDDVDVGRLCSRLLQGGAKRLGSPSRWSALFARGVHRIERLIHVRQLAIDAEAHGLETRADFFWEELQRELAWLARHQDRWRAYVDLIAPDDGTRPDPQQLFRAFVRIEALNVHLSFFYAWDEKAMARRYVHLEHIRRLRGIAGLSPEADHRWIGPLTAREIRFRQERAEWTTAVALGADLIRQVPDVSEYEDLFVAARCAATLADRKPGRDGTPHRHDARVLASGLYELKKFRVDRPHNLATFTAIARLHVARAEVLAARRELAEALVDVEAALTYSPDDAAGAELRARLEDEMQHLRMQLAADHPSAQAPGRRAEAQRRQQAAKNFRLVEAFRHSDEARSVRDDLPVAQGRHVWETIGLGSLEAVDLRPLALNDAIQTIVNAPPPSVARLADEWRRVSRDNPHLNVLDGRRVCEYIAHLLFAEPFTPAPGISPIETTPAVLFAAAPARSSEPFMFWVLSSRNPLVKSMVVSAAVLAVIATVLAVGELQGRKVRAEAYASLLRARDEGRHEQVLDAAERFFSKQLIGADDRVAEVDAAYSEALVRWFNQTMPAPEEAERRLQRYRRLVSVGSDAVR